MKPVWWTCGCGEKQMSTGFGRPKCQACGKDAQFAPPPPKGQQGFAFTADSEAEQERVG